VNSVDESPEASLAGARAIADAVLFEGYMLYPYRANDPKNRVRWQFGVLAPPAFVAADPSERSSLQSECLVDGGDVEVTVQVRFLQVQRRTVEQSSGDDFVRVDSLDLGAATYLPWDEAVVHESTLAFTMPGRSDCDAARQVRAPAGSEIEELTDEAGAVVGRLVRERLALEAELELTAVVLPGPYGVRRLRLRLTNRTSWRRAEGGGPDRADALRGSLVAAHLLVAVRGGAFISLIDPPEWASEYV
jgi:hypothetical protein